MESFPDRFCAEHCGFVPRGAAQDLEESLRCARAAIVANTQAARWDHAQRAIFQVSPEGAVRRCVDIRHARALTELDARTDYRVNVARRVLFIRTLYGELHARFGDRFMTIREPDGSTMLFFPHVPDSPVGPEFCIEFV